MEPENSQSSRAEDDDPVDDWGPGDTVVDLELEDLQEFERDVATPQSAPTLLQGYELGRRDERAELLASWDALLQVAEHRGAAKVLHALRDTLVAQRNTQEFVDEFIWRLAFNAGVKLS